MSLGIIAIMLGRLTMTVNECIQACDKVAKPAFTPKVHIPPTLPEISRTQSNKRPRSSVRKKHLAVLAITKDNVNILLTLFTTYDTSSHLLREYGDEIQQTHCEKSMCKTIPIL
ncbi:hypothetical protein F4818DRAFT_425257 [Hypoxylon cercidicola]|nr:hypothetical protein F4818DRAFT_425257 [Hypoxylon cercidicola]